MVRPGFTPSLLVGLGELGAEIISRTQSLICHWPDSLQNLVQTVQVEECEENTYPQVLQEKLGKLKASKVLNQAEIEAEVQIRRQSGPLEINVYLIGQLGSTPGGLTLEQVFCELQGLEYSWSSTAGYTGATITTLALLGGGEVDHTFVLSRLLAMYRTEQFLDSYGGRILLLDRASRDGSQLDWQDLIAALARCLYLSLSPGDEPLLLPELGLIRKQEKELKLTTLGISCLYLPWRESIKDLGRNWLESLSKDLQSKPRDKVQIEQADSQLLQLLTIPNMEKLLEQNFDVGAILKELRADLEQEVNQRLTGPEPSASLRLLCRLEKQIRGMQEEVYDRCRELDQDFRIFTPLPRVTPTETKEVMPTPAPIIVEEYREPTQQGGSLRYLIFGLVGLTVIYRMTYNQFLPLWLGWGLAALLLVLGFTLMYPSSSEEYYDEYQYHTQAPISSFSFEQPWTEGPREEKPELQKQQRLLDMLLVMLGDLLRDSHQWAQEIERLGETCHSLAKELKEEKFSVLNRELSECELGYEPGFSTEHLLPHAWQKKDQTELRALLIGGIKSQIKAFKYTPEQETALLQEWVKERGSIDTQPLLLFREGGKPLRQLESLSCSARILGQVGRRQGLRLVEGQWDMICAVTFYFGIEPSQICLRAKEHNTA
ncbi:MAG TPA: hypothetical protein VFF14_01010 [Candidatus Deferrimicrobium sp.]|nr:hypothetical protein [Candidatus Deferrimicrobium sp.]